MSDSGHLRIGDAERDAMTGSLHEHFVQGRLDREELDERLAATMTAKTIADLRVIDRDLPRPPAAYDPGEAFAHRRHVRRGEPGPHRFRPRPLVMAAAVIAIAAVAHGGVLFALLHVLLVFWLVRAVAGMARGRSGHRMRGLRGATGPDPRPGGGQYHSQRMPW